MSSGPHQLCYHFCLVACKVSTPSMPQGCAPFIRAVQQGECRVQMQMSSFGPEEGAAGFGWQDELEKFGKVSSAV